MPPRKVSLEKCATKLFYLMFVQQQGQLFYSKLEEYRSMWKEQGKNFWVRFVTTLRNEALLQREFLPEDCDSVFIELLKRITADSFSPVEQYIHEVNVLVMIRVDHKNIDLQDFLTGDHPYADNAELSAAMTNIFGSIEGLSRNQLQARFRLSLRCAGTLIRLIDEWRQSPNGTSVMPVPRLWLQARAVAQPYEVYIRSRWGDELSKVLGVELSKLGWWNARPSTTKPKAQHALQLPQRRHRRTPNWLQETAAWAERLPKIEPVEVGLSFRARLQAQRGVEQRWNLLDIGLLPPLSSRFLGGARGELQLPGDASTCVWAGACQEGFSAQYCLLQQSQHYDLEAHRHSANYNSVLEKWEINMNDLNGMIKRMREDYVGAPRAADLAQSAAEILLEPAALLSLPSCPANLHTWLAVALIEIQKFEVDSLELRHWPLPAKLEEPARELMSMISFCKERVLLAFALFTKHVTDFMDMAPDGELFLLMMEGAILPATAGLEQLCSGQARENLAELKRQAWCEPSSLDDRVSLPLACYEISEVPASVHHNCYLHFNHWIDMGFILEPWPAVSLMCMEVPEILQQLRRNVVPPAEYPAKYVVNNLDQNEWEYASHWFQPHTSEQYIDVSKEAPKVLSQCRKVLRSVAQLGHVSSKAVEALIEDITLDTVRRLPEKLNFPKCGELSLPQQAVFYSCMYTHLSSALQGLDAEEDSLMWWSVRLSGEVVTREQLVRLVAVVSLHSNTCPIISTCDATLCLPEKPRDPAALLKDLRKVTRASSRDLEWLKKQMPADWQKPFNFKEPEPNFQDGRLDLDELIVSLEARHGRLLLNATLLSLSLLDKCDFHLELQFLAPYYLSALRQLAVENEDHAFALAEMVHHLLKSYEQQMQSWKTGKYIRPFVRMKINYMKNVYELAKDVDCKLTNSVFLGQHCLQIAMGRFHAYIGGGYREMDGIPGYMDFVESMHQWPENTVADPNQPIEAEVFMRLAWQNFCFPHCKNVMAACLQTWPDYTPKNPNMVELMYKSRLMMRLESQIFAELTRIPRNTVLLQLTSEDFNEFSDKLGTIMTWRREFLSRVIHEDENPGSLKECADEGRKIMHRLWELAKKLRKKVEYNFHLIDFPSSGHPTITQAIRHFANNNIRETERYVLQPGIFLSEENDLRARLERAVLDPEREQSRRQRRRPGRRQVPGSESAVPTKKKTTHIRPPTLAEQAAGAATECRKCHKMEIYAGTFLKCTKCAQDDYPDPNFFCSPRCRQVWWEIEHYAEHLEYELGISPLCSKK